MYWEKVKLGEICSIEKGNVGIMKAIPGEYPLVVLSEERRTHNEFQFDDEAVIVPLVSSTGHGHRSMKRIFFQAGKFSIGSILCAVIPKDKTQLSAEFLYRYLDFNKETELVGRMRGMANVTLPMKEIAEVEVPLPPLEIQKELITEFQKLESGKNQISTELDHQLALVKELRQAYLREAIQGKLAPQDSTDEPSEILLEKIKAEKEKLVAEKRIKRDKLLPPIEPDETPFEIPANWAWCRLGEIVSILGDGLHGTPEYSNDGEYYFVNGNNLINGKIEFKSSTKTVSFEEYDRHKKEMNANTVLVSINGTLGNIAYFDNEKIILGKSACYFNLLSGIHKQFIGFLIKSRYFLKYAVDVASETTIKNVSLKSMRHLPVPLPPLAEQERIVAKLEKLMKFCDELEATSNKVSPTPTAYSKPQFEKPYSQGK